MFRPPREDFYTGTLDEERDTMRHSLMFSAVVRHVIEGVVSR